MLPQPRQLRGFVDWMDGGSLGVLFSDGDGADFELFFPVRPGGAEASTFAEPELRRDVAHQYTNRFNGENLGYQTREDTPVSWDDAARLLDTLAALEPGDIPDADKSFAGLRAIVRARGALRDPQ